MQIQQTSKRTGFGRVAHGTGFVLYGYPPDSRKFFTRWFPSAEAAQAFADKRGWPIQEIKPTGDAQLDCIQSMGKANADAAALAYYKATHAAALPDESDL